MQQAPTIHLTDYQPPSFLIDSVALEFHLEPLATLVKSSMQVRRNPASSDSSHSLRLDGQTLELLEIRRDDHLLSASEYELTATGLSIHTMPEFCTLQITTRIQPANNTALEGLYVSSGMFCTQCEAQGFRRITYFLDRPDVMAKYSTTIYADKTQYPVLLSNGNPVAQGDGTDNQHWVRWEDPFPKPCYLFALVAGKLSMQEDQYVTASGRKVTLRIYVEPQNSHKCDHGLRSLKQSMLWDEQTYGREYDLDIFMIVAVDDFNMGAMENKGLNIFNSSCVLASAETATDADFYNIQSIVGHEYFHNWSGNRVTCRDWFQLSLKEGFTVFRDQEFSADLNSAPVKRIADVNILRTHQFAQDASPMAHPVRPDSYVEISNFYTVTVYNKGAEVVRMIRTLVGVAGFRKGTDLYFSRHDGQAVTTDDFVKAMEDANQIDLTQFKRWYSQAGTPCIQVQQEYDTDKKRLLLTLSQSTPPTPGQEEKKPFQIPLAIGLLNRQGQPMTCSLGNARQVDQQLLVLTQASQEFVLEQVSEAPKLSLLREFSAPVKIEFPRSKEDLAFLLGHDSDAFNRWSAGQELAMLVLKELVAQAQSGSPLTLDPLVLGAYEKVLANEALDPALTNQLMTLPSFAYAADQFASLDVDALFTSLLFMKRQIALALKEVFYQRYQSTKTESHYVFNAEQMAKRSLKNLCLHYLMELHDPHIEEICRHQIHQSNNMTDRFSAFATYVHQDFPQRQTVLDEFYQAWKTDTQVLEKWFAVQAGAYLPDILDRVQKLLQHPDFSIRNPNKVRSVVGQFCNANPYYFHAKDGSGYHFLQNFLIQLDALNPQIAARMVTPLIRWRRFDAARAGMMKVALQQILNTPGCSTDTYEVVSKSL